MNFMISKELLEKLISYLAQQKFHEVANLMKALGTLKQIKEVPKEEDKVKE